MEGGPKGLAFFRPIWTSAISLPLAGLIELS
jgi:hypothetical protein